MRALDSACPAAAGARTALAAIGVFAGCLAGGYAASLMRYPPLDTAVLFPPYAVLTAGLLLTPARSWGWLILGAAAGTVLSRLGVGWSLTILLSAEVANLIRALTAAAGVRWLCSSSNPFETLRDTVIFLVCTAVLGPMVGAWIGAGMMMLYGLTDSFGVAWLAWMLSNSLTGLTLLPLILIVSLEAHGWVRRPAPLRILESTVLTLGLLSVGLWLFASIHDDGVPTRLYAPLPFLLWAAVRFGSAGTIVMLTAITTLAVGGVTTGRGPFDTASGIANLLHLQFFLIAIALPLLMLASLVRQQARTETELRRSQTQYRSIVEDQTELICRLLPDGTYTFVNGAYCRYFGFKAEDLVGRSFWMFIPPDQRQDARAFLDSITPEHPVATREHKVLGPGGEVRWHQWTDRGLFDAHGRLLEYQAVGSDITERKRLEEERRQMEAQKRVEEALREADRRKDEFLAMLGHELRNPLASVGVALEVLRRAASVDEQTAWSRDVIGRQMDQIRRLVDDLLDVSRITHGKIRLLMEPVDLARVVTQAVETSRPHIDSRHHLLTVTLPDAPVIVRGDAVRLAQVVSNLLNNAAQYTEPGGRVELALTRRPLNGGGNDAMLVVRDNGAGIAPALLPHVFDLFRQGQPASDDAQKGLGIGLTLVKQLVELHGGRVDARSDRPGGGSELIVHLPMAEAAEREDGPRPGPAVDGTPLRVLIVDDNVDVAKSLARLLATWGHLVRTANDAPVALEEFDAFAPHAVLLDHGLPKMDGLEVARRLRARHTDRRLLLIAMTGYGQIQHQRRSTKAGFDHHFTKPIDIEMLQRLLAVHSQTASREASERPVHATSRSGSA